MARYKASVPLRFGKGSTAQSLVRGEEFDESAAPDWINTRHRPRPETWIEWALRSGVISQVESSEPESVPQAQFTVETEDIDVNNSPD